MYDMTRYDEIMGGKPARSRHLAGNIPTTCQNRSAKPSATSKLLSTLLLLLLMVLGGANEAWGQLDGVYNIANHWNKENPVYEYDVDNPTNNFYLVPAKNPAQENKCDAYFSEDYDDAYGDPGKPFLTTYQTNKDVNSAWVIKSAGSNQYFLIHVLTGKYAVYQTTPDCVTAGKSHRKAIHLETLTDPDNTAKAKFYIEDRYSTITGTYTFRPQSLNSGNRFFNPTNGNKQHYNAQGGDCNNAGLIGVYSSFNSTNDRGTLWHIETTKLPAPTIVYDSDNDKFTISYDIIPAGFTILYTTDGSNPEI